MSASAETGRTCVCWSTWRTGASSAIPPGGPRDASLVLGAFATLDFPLTDVQVFHTDRGGGFDDTRIDDLLDVFGIKRSLSRKGNPYDNAVVESTNRPLKKELV